jgi:hypothetical protein
MTRWKSYAQCALAAASLLGLAVGVASAEVDDAAKKEYWQKRYAQILVRAAGAERQLAMSRVAYRESRQRDRPRGEARQQLVVALQEAETEYEAASKLLAEFPEDARRAGIPPGWLREVEERQAGAG